MGRAESNCIFDMCYFLDLNDNVTNLKSDEASLSSRDGIAATSDFILEEKLNSAFRKSGDDGFDNSETLATHFRDLPVEILLKILGYLSQAELYYRVSFVNRLWRQVAFDETLWKSIDYNTTHEDLEMLHGREKEVDSKENESQKLQRGHLNFFERTLSTFSNCVTAIKLSRYLSDQVPRETLSQCLSSCKNVVLLDLGFCDNLNLRDICTNCLQLRTLNLEGCKSLQDDDFCLISNLTSLHTLDISHCVFLTSKFLLHLYDLPNLRHFSCDGVMNISDWELIDFFRQQSLLETVVLDGEDMTDTPVSFAAAYVPRLKCLKISFCQELSDNSVLAFRGKHKLEELQFRKASKLTSRAFCQLFSPCSIFSLTNFTITECIGFDDASLTALSACCPNLKKVCVDWCDFTDEGVHALVLNCKKLRSLSFVGLFSLTGTPWVNDLEKTLPQLEYLDMSNCNDMSDDALFALVSRKPTLTVYSYFHEQISSEKPPQHLHDIFHSSSEEDWKCPGEKGVTVDF